MRGTTTPEDPRERELYWKKQRQEGAANQSGLVNHFRQASKIQAEAWEYLCAACSHVNLVQSSDPDATIGQHFCERCGTTLAFANKEYAKQEALRRIALIEAEGVT